MTMTDESTQDGFDLIEYPCVYSFKAMCRADAGDSKTMVRQLVKLHVDDSAIKEVHETSSRTGKFKSVTISVDLPNRNKLEAIYKELADCNEVLMTL